MNNNTQITFSINHLHRLASFADYLLQTELDNFVHKYIQYIYQHDVPLLKFFLPLSEEERFTVTKNSIAKLLEGIAKNEAEEQINKSLLLWKENRLPVIDKDEVIAEDITLIHLIRKKAMMDFVPVYTHDPYLMIQLINEMDLFTMHFITASTNVFINLYKERLEEQVHLIQKVNETIPGAVYVFDRKMYKGIYSNSKISTVIGYDHDSLNQLGHNAIEKLIHPDDQPLIEDIQKRLSKANDGEVLVSKYRIKNKNGTYKWLANYESVFKRHPDDSVWQTIGITLDIDKEQNTVEELHHREQQLLEAQEIAQLGSFYRDLENKTSTASPKTLELLDIDTPDFDKLIEKIHVDDRAKVKKASLNALKTGVYACEYKLVGKKGIRFISSKGVVQYANDKAIGIKGTVQDVTEKQKLIEQLSNSDQLYKQAQTMAQMGSWTHDLITNETHWSDELFEIYELPNKVALSITEWSNYLDPEEKKEIFSALEKGIQDHTAIDKIHKIILPDGRIKILHRKAEIIYNESDEAIRLIGTTQDITQQHAVQVELKESQTFIKKITDATPSIISLYNTNTGAYTFISEGLKNLLGYTVLEVLPKGVSFMKEIVHPDDFEAMTEKNRTALEEANHTPDKNDRVIEFTYRLRHKDGHYRWFHTYGAIFDRNKNGSVEHILNISLDITEQREAIQKIKEQEYFIQQIADASPTILYLFDIPTQSIGYINREAFFVLGYLPEEIIEEGENITTLLYHPEDIHLLPGRKESDKGFRQVDSMIQYECRMKNKDGKYCWLLVREIVFKTNAAGTITQIIGAALDITRRKEMEKTILQNTLQLEQSNASLEEFAYVASHDLKEPLRKISSFGDRLVNSFSDNLNAEGTIYLRKIVEASQRMQNMINDLLAISIISANKAFEKYSLQKILEDTLQTLDYKIELQKAIIRYDILPELTIVPSQFRQLFQNLMANSLKFAREHVQTIITVSCKNVGQEEINGYQPKKSDSYWMLTFSDNGIGFENEYAQKIFAIFQRLHGRSEYEGSGIGLAICKKIVEHHGGVIFAKAKPELGASFTIILPA